MFHTVLDRRDTVQRLMGPVVVISVQPVLGHLPYLVQSLEDIAVQHLGSVGLVESFNIGVLRRLSGLDVVEGNALELSPFSKGVGYELGAVVQANGQRCTAHIDQLLQGADEPRRWQAGVNLNAQDLPVILVDQVERPQALT